MEWGVGRSVNQPEVKGGNGRADLPSVHACLSAFLLPCTDHRVGLGLDRPFQLCHRSRQPGKQSSSCPFARPAEVGEVKGASSCQAAVALEALVLPPGPKRQRAAKTI